jgi:transcription-repair coupling factor (superfamily II helicase)
VNLASALKLIDTLPAFRRLVQELGEGNSPRPLGLIDGAKPPIVASLFNAVPRTLLLILDRVDAVPIWQQSIEAWLQEGMEVLRFPEPTPLPNERGPWSRATRQRRLDVMTRLMTGQSPQMPGVAKPLFIVTSARALLQKTLPKRRFVAASRVLRAGQLIDLDRLVQGWSDSGYEAVSVVESVGQFSRRGGILDLYPLGSPFPIRVELFGDEIETLRYFDPSTQRSIALGDGDPGRIMIPPARELLPVDAAPLGSYLQEEVGLARIDLPSWLDDIQDLAAGQPTPNLEYYLPMAYSKAASLLDYLPDGAIVALDDPVKLAQAVRHLHEQAQRIDAEQADRPPGYQGPLWSEDELEQALQRHARVVLGDGLQRDGLSVSGLAEAFKPGPRYGGQVRPFLMQLRDTVATGERTVVVSRQAHRLAELWWEDQEKRGEILIERPAPGTSLEMVPGPGTVTFLQGSLAGGFILERGSDRLARASANGSVSLNLLTDAEVFGWSRPAPRRTARPRPVAPERRFADIAPGDHVVHVEFGIGRFVGLVVRAIGGMEREYLQVNFANTDVLYVPVHHADRLSKWIGSDERPPRLDRLGDKSWKRAKTKAQKAVDELVDELLDLYAARETISGHAFGTDTPWQAELEASFAYQETEDQLRAIAEVRADMERPYPMDRLICGDVGYGKTEVALRAAFKAVMDGKQVAMLVPTTVLAQQHYGNFLERLSPFPVQVEMLSRFRTPAHQEQILKRLRSGQLDIVIGTHRLLSDDVSFKDLGLLVIDEEQRFGVAHKEKLKQLRTEVDVLTTTATPIPRTLYMSLTGVRDISIIDTPPSDRLPVETFVGTADDTMVRRAILRELDRGGQVFYVHNRVQTIRTMESRLSWIMPEATIAVAHGQMSERELEEVMIRFVQGEIDVLLTTTIIESGLDIPNANTLIVDRADRFGLAQLYQLKGRVGRGVRRAYAYFFHAPWHRLNADAQARLEVIASQTELGAGYGIAMRDLEIRGAGDMLGARQSGHIAAVGFDLYTRLLKQAVSRRRAARLGEPIPLDLPEPVLIDLPLAAYVPKDYVPDASLRLRLYRRMAVLESLAAVDRMASELADRFGPIPDPVDNLLYQLRAKVMAAAAGVAAVSTEGGQVMIRLPDGRASGRMALQRFLGLDIRVSRRAIWLGRDVPTNEWRIKLIQVLEKLQAYEFQMAPVTETTGAAD